MSEGGSAWLHLVADGVHLLVAGAWFGALVALVLVASQASGKADAASVRLLADVSRGFASLGSIIVVVLFASGIANYLFVVGPELSEVFANTYGRLLLAKLGLFAGMLALAAANRFRFAPALARALQENDAASAVSTLRNSLWLETGLAVVVLVLVALLGTLDPAG
jgi:putative copper resistance protein D